VQFPPTVTDEGKLVEIALRYQRQVTTQHLDSLRARFKPKILEQMATFNEQLAAMDEPATTKTATTSQSAPVSSLSKTVESWSLVEDEGKEERQGKPVKAQAAATKLSREPSFELVDDEQVLDTTTTTTTTHTAPGAVLGVGGPKKPKFVDVDVGDDF